MIVEVTKENVMITQGSVINSDELGVNECEFVLPPCFDGLDVTAVFNGIPVPLVACKCWVPSLEMGNAVLGVYAYKEVDGKIELMYSPKPTVFFVSQGSYCNEINESAVPQISQYEQYCKMILDKCKDVLNDLIVSEFDPETEPGENQVYSAIATATMGQYLFDMFNLMVSDAEHTTNKVATINADSTDTQYPSAKAVFDFGNQWYQALKGDLDELSLLIGEDETIIEGGFGDMEDPDGGDKMPPTPSV